MIVCLCHRVSDRDIRHAVDAGIRNFDVLQDETRVASACGCCHDCAREVFDAAVGSKHGACPGLCHIDNAAGTAMQTIALVKA
ncbi:(2Fe-2S)-binding protein [Roseateles sp. DAIF2]|uniref:(2Fe-2S)-binding protein n=1 Tax=Roseateles sp. DAIF2 TaxID=2714952 RepID=UPI0018A30BC9|nr:(2Fe-2S)-binding protein [Roseateles sp. DAIF2]QPF75129.1 (2Fe-2S)-binding protein [Roseateles sp. DAIF2]